MTGARRRLRVSAALFLLIAAPAGSECIGPDIVLGGVKSVDNFADSEPNGRAGHFGIPQSPTCPGGWNLPVLSLTRDAGVTWPRQALVESDCAYSTETMLGGIAIAADGAGRLFVAWMAGAVDQTFPVVRVSPDDGVTWPEPTLTLAAPARSGGPQLLTGGPGEAWLFWWAEDATGGRRVYSSYTGDGGRSFGPPRLLDDGLVDPGKVAVLRDERGNLHAAARTGSATDSRLVYTRSVDGGGAWSPARAIDGLAAGVRGGAPVLLTLPGGRLLVAWSDGRSGSQDVFVSVSGDGGLTWPEAPVRVDLGDAPGAAGSSLPAVVRAGPGGELCAAWEERRDGVVKVYASTSADSGATWSASPAPVVGSESAFGFALAGDAHTGRVRLWFYAGDTYTALSVDGGRTFSSASPLGAALGFQLTSVSYPFGAHGLLYLDSRVETHHLRLDGPAAVEALGATTYCAGSDPRLEARATSASCPSWLYQWHVDGVAAPGATSPAFTPALAPGDHSVEVRVTCATPVACTPPSLPLALHVRTPAAPPDVGNRLRVVREAGGSVALDWSGAQPAPEAHAHVGRALGRLGGWSPVSPAHDLTATSLVDLPPAADLVRYRVLRADLCEAESAD